MTIETMHQQTDAAASSTKLPLLYRSLEPVNSQVHRNIAVRPTEDYRFAAAATGIPITLAEVDRAQAHYPIVFSQAKTPVPMAVTGVPEGGNRFVDEAGHWQDGAYIPAYVRRYPFIVVKEAPESDALSLCLDPTADCVETAAAEGNLFEGDEPSETVRPIIGLCREFEAAARQTETVMAKLVELDLLIDGQAQVRKGAQTPAVFRGFRIVSEQKLHALAPDDIADLLRCGALGLIYAHLLSLRHLGEYA